MTDRQIAIGAIMVNRPDFHIGSMFQYDGLWHAVASNKGDVAFVCVRVNNGKVEGVNPYAPEIDRDAFFNEVNYGASYLSGRPIVPKTPDISEKFLRIVGSTNER